MFLVNIDQILKNMPHVRHGYYLPFHEDHLSNFKGIAEYGSKSLSIEDRKRLIVFQSTIGPCITAFVDGHPVAMFGCVFLWRGVGEAWSLFTEQSRRYPIAMTKGAISFFNSCQTLFNLHRLQITVNSNDKRAMSWAKTLGFVSEGLMIDYSADKDDTHMMRRT